MRHAKKRHQLNRFTSWHKATMVSMARNMLIYQSMVTSPAKAKAVRPLIEKLISLSKKNTLAAKRDAFAILKDHKLVQLLFSDIGPRFAKRQGGYTRILRMDRRRGDNAEVAIFELTEIKKKEIKKAKKDVKSEEKPKDEAAQEKILIEKENNAAKEKPTVAQKPPKKFLGGIRSIFKKERDSL